MGYSASVIATTLAQPSFYTFFATGLTTPLIGTMNGLFQAGAFFGALCISWVGDHWGRKWGISIACILVLISGALLAASQNLAMFLAFRFFAGMGSWWLLGGVPVYLSEIVPPKNRGLLVDIHSAALLLGYTIASWVGYGFYHLDTGDVSDRVLVQVMEASTNQYLERFYLEIPLRLAVSLPSHPSCCHEVVT